MKAVFRLVSTLMIATVAIAPAAFAQVQVGTPNTVQPNSFPFGSGVGFTTFQQVYSASLFSGPIDIAAISLYNTRGTGNFQVGTFNLFLSTTTVASTAVTNNPAANRTGPLQAFTSVTYAANTPAPTITTFEGTAFSYNPMSGNLLFEVQFTPVGFNTNPAFFDRVQTADPARTMVGTASTSSPFFGTRGSPNSGFVTTFTAAAAPVPEPTTWMLLVLGLSGLAIMSVRRRSHGHSA